LERRERLARHPYLMRTARVRELVAHGRTLMDQGEYERAVAELHQAQQLEPQSRDIGSLLAEARRRQELGRSSRELARGLEAEKQGDVEAALAAYRLAFSLDTNNAEAAFKAAEALHKKGGLSREVRQLAQRAVELAPRHAGYRFFLGLLLQEEGAKKVARKHFEEVLALQPGHEGAKAQLKRLKWLF
jgi:cytochrome c-type biogenesis protein CcmH/NrfG